MNWFKKISEQEYGYWIDPEGKKIPVESYDHSGMAYKIITEKYKLQYRKRMTDDPTFDGDVFNFLYSLNYIRVLTYMGNIEVNCDHNPNMGQISSIMEIINRYHGETATISVGKKVQNFNRTNFQYIKKFLEGNSVNLRTSPIVNIRNNPIFFNTANAKIAAKWKDKLKGGLADDKTPEDFDKKQVEQGTEVEKEHTDDEHLAEEISLDHLEDPLYYEKLKTIEKRFAKKHNVLDTQLLCCQFPQNRRKNPYKKNKRDKK